MARARKKADNQPERRAPVPAVARRMLVRRFEKVRRLLPRAAHEGRKSARRVHDLRVEARRAFAAMKLYREFLPRNSTRHLRRHLRKIRRAAGAARELDVFAAGLAKYRGRKIGRRLLRKAAAERPRALKRVKNEIRRAERAHLWAEASVLLRALRRAPPGAGPRFSLWARAQLRPLLRDFAAALPENFSDLGGLHRFRIRCKKLRYALEMLAGAFDPRAFERVGARVTTLQDLLGTVNDCVEQRRRLARWLPRHPGRRARREEAVLVAANERRLSRALRELARLRRTGFFPELLRDLRRLLALPGAG